MQPHVLIIGGTGRIGRAVAADLLKTTHCTLCLTGRQGPAPAWLSAWGERVRWQALDLQNQGEVKDAIATTPLVIHCAGPFHDRDHQVLAHCIAQGIDYLDVSDQRDYTIQALTYRDQAQQTGTTAIINTGIFPGISNSMVRQDIEALDQAESIQLSYVVAGSGGAGPTVMRTTFLGLQHPFTIWRDGQWQTVPPIVNEKPSHSQPPMAA